MDPLSCLAIAGAVVQFVDFGTKIIVECKSIYKDGEASIRRRGMESTNDLRDFSAKFEQSLCEGRDKDSHSEDELALKALCGKCKELADELVTKMNTLTVEDKRRVWKNLGTALASVWSRKGIEETRERLNEYRRAIDTRMVGLIGASLNLMAVQQAERFQKLDEETRQIVLSLVDLRGSIARTTKPQTLKAQAMAVAQVLNRQKIVVKSHTETTARVVIDAYDDELILGDAEGIELDDVEEFRAAEAELRKAIAVDILESLRFLTLTERFDEVKEAHHKTFAWIFDHPKEDSSDRHWDDFVTWLEEGNGVYWMNGKAGSGKSTLLKYVYNHPRTMEHLAVWQGDDDLHIANFFFWNSGTPLQKSQEGLLRSLLYDILWKVPKLIPIIFPDQWARLYMMKLNLPIGSPGISWTLSILLQAFKALMEQNMISMKLCLFIDGLDEYSGLPGDLAKLVQTTTDVKNVKLCVSSRPYVVYKERFSKQPQLRLEDLTQGDIQQYVLDMIDKDQWIHDHSDKEREQLDQLVNEIVSSAAGVFMWVKLIVIDLKRGLENHDRISQLQQRLKQLPTDLRELYEHMVIRVDEIYKVEASKFFQLIAAAIERKDDWRPVQPLTMQTLALAEENDPDFVFKAPPGFLSADDIQSRIEDLDLRLRKCCGGLLETQYGKSSLRVVAPGMKVSYIHRTVKDYLDDPETGIRNVLSLRTGGLSAGSFNPHVALQRAYILELKALEPVPESAVAAQYLVDNAITFARRAEGDLCVPNDDLMDELLSSANRWWQSAEGKDLLPPNQTIISVAIQCGLHQLLQAKLEAESRSIDDLDELHGRPLLDYAVNPAEAFRPFTPKLLASVSKQTVMVLLEHGANPNKPWKNSRGISQSPWQNALTYLVCKPYNILGNKNKEDLLTRWAGVLMALVQYRANVGANCVGQPKALFDSDGAPTLNKDGMRMLVETTSNIEMAVQEVFSGLSRNKAVETLTSNVAIRLKSTSS